MDQVMYKWHGNKAFSMIEIIIVVIILGVLAGLALPKYTMSMESTRMAEGVKAATVLYAAQRRYFLENNQYTNAIADLDVELTLDNFSITLDTSDPIVSLERVGSSKSYAIDSDTTGALSCSGIDSTYCDRLKTW